MRTLAVASVIAFVAGTMSYPALAKGPQPTFTHDGWGKAKFGMTFDDLRRAFPGAEVSGLCVTESNVTPGCRDLMVTTNMGPGWHISLSFSNQDRLSEINFYRNDNPGMGDYAAAVAQQSRTLTAGKEDSFNSDDCGAVLAKWNAGTSVRNFEFFAHDVGRRTTLTKGDRSAVITLKDDARCAGGPADLYKRPLTRILNVEYKDTSVSSE